MAQSCCHVWSQQWKPSRFAAYVGFGLFDEGNLINLYWLLCVFTVVNLVFCSYVNMSVSQLLECYNSSLFSLSFVHFYHFYLLGAFHFRFIPSHTIGWFLATYYAVYFVVKYHIPFLDFEETKREKILLSKVISNYLPSWNNIFVPIIDDILIYSHAKQTIYKTCM